MITNGSWQDPMLEGGVQTDRKYVRILGVSLQIVQTRTGGRVGVKKPEIFAYVLNGSPLTSFFPRKKWRRRTAAERTATADDGQRNRGWYERAPVRSTQSLGYKKSI